MNKYKDNEYFGGNGLKALTRDNYTCVKCGMTDKEHKQKWGRSITIDHIDGNGRYAKKEDKNHNLSNLQTLCLSCHCRKDRSGIRKHPVIGGKKTCRICSTKKPVESFGKYKNGYVKNECKYCSNIIYCRKYRAMKRRNKTT